MDRVADSKHGFLAQFSDNDPLVAREAVQVIERLKNSYSGIWEQDVCLPMEKKIDPLEMHFVDWTHDLNVCAQILVLNCSKERVERICRSLREYAASAEI